MELRTKIELTNYAIDKLKDSISIDRNYGCDLHHEIFNTDYYIIGHYEAEKWLIEHTGIFAAIEEIKNYEKVNFGEVNTDFSSSENVCNMIVYIYGEQILSESNHLRDECWNEKLSQKDINKIIKELKDSIK